MNRDRAEWMNEASLPVLEFLEETGFAYPVEVIHYNVTRTPAHSFDQETVLHAILELKSRGLVRAIDGPRAYYEDGEGTPVSRWRGRARQVGR